MALHIVLDIYICAFKGPCWFPAYHSSFGWPSELDPSLLLVSVVWWSPNTSPGKTSSTLPLVPCFLETGLGFLGPCLSSLLLLFCHCCCATVYQWIRTNGNQVFGRLLFRFSSQKRVFILKAASQKRRETRSDTNLEIPGLGLECVAQKEVWVSPETEWLKTSTKNILLQSNHTSPEIQFWVGWMITTKLLLK